MNNDVSPAKSFTNKNRTVSPTRRSQQQQHNFQGDPKDLLHGLTEKEIEIENLKTIIVAQDQKLKVLDSVRDDLAIARDALKYSEANRFLLQEQLRQNAEKAKEEAAKNHKF